jgi:hypothetical protein
MLTYVYFGTNDLDRATRFYDAALTLLGMQRCVTGDPEWDRISAGRGVVARRRGGHTITSRRWVQRGDPETLRLSPHSTDPRLTRACLRQASWCASTESPPATVRLTSC